MKRIFGFLTVLYASFACNSKETNLGIRDITLTDEIVELPLPENIGHFELEMSHYDQGGNVQLLIFDQKTFSFHQMDVNSKCIIQSTMLEKEGPNGINAAEVYGLLMEHSDSLFLFTALNEIIQLNIKGDIVRKIPINMQLSEQLDISLYPESFTRYGDDFYIPSVPLTFQWNEIAVNDILNTPSATKFSLQSNQLTPISNFDKNFIGNNLNKPLFPKFHKGPDGDMILSYNYKDVTVIHTDKSQSVKSLKASMVPDEAPASTKNIFEDMDEFDRIFYRSNTYTDLHYFKDQQVLMRVVQLEEGKSDIIPMDDYVPQQYVLLFYDQDYNKIGEMELNKDTYNARLFYGTADGIFICLDHPENPDLQEGVMRFQKIKIN